MYVTARTPVIDDTCADKQFCDHAYQIQCPLPLLNPLSKREAAKDRLHEAQSLRFEWRALVELSLADSGSLGELAPRKMPE